METLVLDGKEYVKASKAAQHIGYTTDYVGQLCRSGKIDARLIGRSWYVNLSELGSHRTESKRTSRIKAREQVRKSLEERKRSEALQQTKNYERHITYENDDTELMPEVQKVRVESERTSPKKKTSNKEEPAYTIENQGKKVIMQGDLKVIDATDEPVDEHTVVLGAKIVKQSTESKNTKEPTGRQISRSSSDKGNEITSKKLAISEAKEAGEMTSFERKLEELEKEVEAVEGQSGSGSSQEVDAIGEVHDQKNRSVTHYLPLITAVVGFLAIGSLLSLETVWNYREGVSEGDTQFDSTVHFEMVSFRHFSDVLKN